MVSRKVHLLTSSTRVTRPIAFTLVELLVVIGIVSVLMGILVPVVGKARRQSNMIAELGASRQLMIAYLGYTTENKGALIPGHGIENLKLTDDKGKLLAPAEAGKRWPWRLMAHIKYGLKGTLLINNQIDVQANRTDPMWAYYVSLLPSFGLNYYNLGGDQTNGGISNSPGWAKKITQINYPHRMIAFTSARAPLGMPFPDGYFKIIPPTKSSEYSAAGWTTDDFTSAGEPAAWGYVDLRWDKRAVVAFLDGHSDLLGLAELRDMTRWSNPAALAGDPNWHAP